jgi:DNA polymerase III subunit delta
MSAGFQAAERWIAGVDPAKLRPGYVLLGDEAFLLERARAALVRAVVPPGMREWCLSELELPESSIFEVLDRARMQSLMSPAQLVLVRGLKTLYTRGAKKEEWAAVEAYFRSPNPSAVVAFVVDHIRIPADARRMEMENKARYDRVRETLGEWCQVVELPRADEEDAVRWLRTEAARREVTIEDSAARELADALGADMMLVASEMEKLVLYSTAPGREGSAITLADVETMVLAAKQRSLYELTDAISRHDRARALLLLHGLLNSSDAGEDAAIGHLFLLARTFRQMLVVLEKNVRDSRAIWAALWPGFRLPGYAADDLIRQARRYTSRAELARNLRLLARADLDLRSQPADKRLVLEQLVWELATPVGNKRTSAAS